MAEMIPDRLPARATASERRLFAALARLPADCLVYFEPVVANRYPDFIVIRLPADCLVYFEPVVANRYPDFIVIAPSLGVLTIELKGWCSGDIAGADTHAVLLREPSRVSGPETVTRRNHPVRQARD